MPKLSLTLSSSQTRPVGGYAAVRRRTKIVGLLFVTFGVALSGVGIWRAYATYRHLRRNEQLEAEVLTSRTAGRLAVDLNNRFADLRFLARSLLGTHSRPQALSPHTKAELRQFLATHHDILNVNILGPKQDKIFWSARPQAHKPAAPLSKFSPLLDNPHLELGVAFFAKRFRSVIVPLRYAIDNSRGDPRLYIGDPISLSRLTELIPKTRLSIRLTTPNGHVFAHWRRDHLERPNPKAVRWAGHARAAVTGYPWEVRAGWSKEDLWAMWWRNVASWLPLFMLLLWGSQYIGILVVNLLSREMQSRLWHETLHKLNSAILQNAPIPRLFSDAAEAIQTNLLASFVFVGTPSENAVAGPLSADCTESFRRQAFLSATKQSWAVLPCANEPSAAVLGLEGTEAVIIIQLSSRARPAPWSEIVRELAGHLSIAITQKQQDREISRLRRYQAAVSMMQLELLHQPDPNDLYPLLVRILQEQTDILGAFVALPVPQGPQLQIRVAAAQSTTVRDALLRLTPSQDADHYPFGQMLAGRAFRSAKPQGPIDPSKDLALAQAMASEPALASVRSVIAYPLLENGNVKPVAVLVAEGTDPNYFTPAVQELLEHLVASVSLALSAYRTRRQIERYRAFYEALARASQAIARRSDPQRLFRDICNILAEYTGVPLTFISLIENGSARIMATGGLARRFMDDEAVRLQPCDNKLGPLHVRALAAQGPCLFETRDHWIDNEDFKDKAHRQGLESAFTITWQHMGGTPGILGIMAGETAFFDRDLMQLIEAFGRDISFAISDYERQQKLLQLSLYDSLTGLPNRAYFERSANEAMARSTRHQRIMALGIMDLDGFKAWNDLQGHTAGDDLLKAVAQRLREVVREDEGVARLGGDEFGLTVLVDNMDALSILSQRLLRTVAQADDERRVTASLGWALYAPEKTDFAALLAHADEALYAAKADGRNTYRIFGGLIADRLQRRLDTLQQFPNALETGQIVFMLQPQACCISGAPVGIELLARWRTPSGLIPANLFIPDVEKDPRLIRALGRHALAEAVALRDRLRARGCDLRVAFNIGVHHFLHPRFVDEATTSLKGTSAQDLCIEVTENVAISDIRRATEVIIRLKTLGFAVALDDFGAGYSSLKEAAELPVDELKLDQRFIRSFRRDSNAFAVAASVLLLGNLSGRRLIAEGIEEFEDLALWQHMGGEYVQGHLLSAPLLEADFYDWLLGLKPQPVRTAAAFPPKDLILVGYAFLEATSFAASNLSEIRARLREWLHSRSRLYSALPAWNSLNALLQKPEAQNPANEPSAAAQELRVAIITLFSEINEWLYIGKGPFAALGDKTSDHA